MLITLMQLAHISYEELRTCDWDQITSCILKASFSEAYIDIDEQINNYQRKMEHVVSNVPYCVERCRIP